MAEIIEVNTSTLENDTDDIARELIAIRSDMSSMFNAVTELNTMWTGSANAAFTAQFTNDREMMEEMCKNLDGLVESLKFAKAEYEKCENQVLGTVRAIKL